MRFLYLLCPYSARKSARNIYCIVRKVKIIVVIVLMLVLVGVCTLRLRQTVTDQIALSGSAKVEEVLHERINRTCRTLLAASDDHNILEKQSESAVSYIDVNAAAIGALATECNVCCTEDLDQFGTLTMTIPRGALTGSAYLADKGRPETFTIKVSYDLSTDYTTVIEAVGINQVRYAVYLVVKATAHVTVPAAVPDKTYAYYIPVCETVYAGVVPNVYVTGEDATNYLDLLP